MHLHINNKLRVHTQNPNYCLQTIHTNIGSFKTVEPEKKQGLNRTVEIERNVFQT
jgi:hypothetical protein